MRLHVKIKTGICEIGRRENKVRLCSAARLHSMANFRLRYSSRLPQEIHVLKLRLKFMKKNRALSFINLWKLKRDRKPYLYKQAAIPRIIISKTISIQKFRLDRSWKKGNKKKTTRFSKNSSQINMEMDGNLRQKEMQLDNLINCVFKSNISILKIGGCLVHL